MPFMPFGYGFMGLVDSGRREPPGVNQGRKRGITKSPKPRRKK